MQGTPLTVSVREAVPGDEALVFAYVQKLAEFEGLADRVVSTEQNLSHALFARKLVGAAIAEATLEAGEVLPVGFVLWYFAYSTFSGKPSLYIEDIYVDEKYRGRGVAREIFSFLKTKARNEGCARLEWSVLSWNSGAQDFYRKMGGAPNAGWETWRMEIQS